MPAGTLAATGNVLANDTPASGQNGAPVVSAVAVQGGAAGVVGQPIVTDFGTLTLNSNGSYTYVPRDSVSTRALAEGQAHTDVFTYTVTNSSGSATGTLSLSISGVNDAPVAAADTATLAEDAGISAVSGNVLANDSDPDAGAHLVVAEVGGQASNVGQVIAGTYGSLKLNADGSYTYTLDNADADTQRLAAGQLATETFSYVVSDNAGGTAQTSLAISITGANDSPTAEADFAMITEDAVPNTIAGNVLANDSDPDAGTQLRVVGVGGQAANLGQAITGTYGSLRLNADGSYVYTLDNADPDTQGLVTGQSGLDIFAYELSDGAGGVSTAQISVTVNGRTGLDAKDDIIAMDTASAAQASFNLFANDSGTAFQLTLLQLPNGSGAGGAGPLTLPSAAGALTVAADGAASYSFTPGAMVVGAGQSFTDIFFYTIRDSLGQSDTATIRITISQEAEYVIDGTGTSDRLDASLIDTVLNGGDGDDVIVGGYGRDVLNGGAGNDRLVGWVDDVFAGKNLANRDQFWGGAGDDLIVGGDSFFSDTAVYSGKRSDYSVQITGDRVVVRDLNFLDGDEGTDTLTGIEILQFSDQNVGLASPFSNLVTSEHGIRDHAIDVSSGGAFSVGSENGAPLFYYAPTTVELLNFAGEEAPSWLGFDLPSQRLVGSAPAGFEGLLDVLIQPTTSGVPGKFDAARLFFYTPKTGDVHGVSGVEEVFNGTAGDDRIFGMGRGDRAIASLGADIYEGVPSENNAGDWPLIDYSGSAEAIYLDLNLGVAHGGFAEGDVLLNVGSIIGTAFGDTIITGMTSEVIDPGAGDDYVAVNGLASHLSSVGYVRVWGGAGADVITGLNWTSNVEVNYSRSAAGISVVVGERASGGDAEGDLLINVSKIVGSSFDDVIRLKSGMDGNSPSSLAEGGDGNDLLEGNRETNILDGGNGNDQLFGLAGNDQLTGGAGADLIDGGLGVDTAVYRGAGPVQIDLSAGTAKGGDAEGDILISIENVRSYSDGADILRGNAADNDLWGQRGDDQLYGMGGNDTLGLFAGGSSAHIDGGDGIDTLLALDLISVDLAAGTATAAFGGGLTLVSVENVYVSGYGTTVYGDDGSNRFTSNANGDVFFYGRGGDDELVGGQGNDFLVGGQGADILRGALGIGSGISSGWDTASYADSAVGVRVDMRIGKGFGGDAEGDSLFQIDHVEGSAGADVLIGNNNVNDLVSSLRGLDGDDVLLAIGEEVALFGDVGNDLLVGGIQNGGAGNDLLVMLDNGQKTITGGAGADTFIFDTAIDNGSAGFHLAATIADFSRAEGDKLDLSDLRDGAGNVLDLDDILANSSVTGGNLVIDLSAFTSSGKSVGGSLTLSGISDPGILTQSDFVFIDGIDWQSQLPANLSLS